MRKFHRGEVTPNIALSGSYCTDVENFLPLVSLFDQSDLIGLCEILLKITQSLYFFLCHSIFQLSDIKPKQNQLLTN